MIPVLGIPILNRGDLFLRCIRSIDYPVDKLVIVNNGRDPTVLAAIEQLAVEQVNGHHDYKLIVFSPQYNLGVAASWNWIIKMHKANYWLLVGNDIRFTPGDLKKIDSFVRKHPHYAVCPANWGHSLFAVLPPAIKQAGYFDENFWPAYCEDQDHQYRIKLAGLPWADVPDVEAVHGEPPLWGSTTVWSNPKLTEQCRITQGLCHEYYRRKWGGYPGEEKFTHPFDNPNLSIKDWIFDENLARATGNPAITMRSVNYRPEIVSSMQTSCQAT